MRGGRGRRDRSVCRDGVDADARQAGLALVDGALGAPPPRTRSRKTVPATWSGPGCAAAAAWAASWGRRSCRIPMSGKLTILPGPTSPRWR
ncbi:hypothetical protein [Tessaracoccus coleopterorum]|uniref:hypothetical protein n=1 Tax=Tessaracoccus coleopterorum TaxID=2714950 RepID=UPI0018D3F230|nr:hypothetical protein [Tessaracoccus coleopterorum]